MTPYRAKTGVFQTGDHREYPLLFREFEVGLEADDVEQRRLEQLALQRGAGDAHHGLARKDELALGDGVDVYMRTKIAQVVEESSLNIAPPAGAWSEAR